MSQRPTVEVNGAQIRTIRMLSGVEMRYLANQIGITSSYLSRIETGSRSRLRPSVYAALRAALGAPDDMLLAPSKERHHKEHAEHVNSGHHSPEADH